MSLLRQQMIRELQLHRKAPDTVKSYVKAVEELARHYGRSRDQISKEEVRDFLHHAIVERKLACSMVNHKLAAIQFFYRTVLGRQINLRIPRKRSGRLPEPFSRQEVARLLEATENRRHRVMMMNGTCTAAAATDTAPSASPWQRPVGWPIDKGNCCRCRTFIRCSLCPIT